MGDKILSEESIEVLGDILTLMQKLKVTEQYIIANLIKGGLDAAYSLEFLKDATEKQILKDFDVNGESH